MKQDISGYTRLAAVIATPIKHSLSPLIHNTAFQELGIDAVYLAFDVEPARFEHVFDSIRDLNMLGVNLSMPYKEPAYRLADELSEAARLIGAVNTIVNQNGRLTGYNTDGEGFVNSLKEARINVTGKRVTVLGAGGAAKAIISQLALTGVEAVDVFKRMDDKFFEIQKGFDTLSEYTGVPVRLHDFYRTDEMSAAIAESHLLVNATQVGMYPETGACPLADAEVLHPDLAVADLIYHPQETQLLQLASARGCRTVNGIGMLIHQAAVAFELWTGRKMPVDSVKQVILKQLQN
ncbi:shikimate dehydrogenase [Vagococcus acidifermentans]|uniref:Shikimate dehydrogenase (NADP(+)) n=1 Tax=Vagococcus acidifermentans TaxID=564710 RepID=A0A430AMX2_9ENTE|nr:shikimate dehydrogenase [Vagococcus acidifermentans]RSU09313.1 shikimate dehydrogenase [Vagococcus acidifermentans]